jgi:hypothetical protein
MSTIDLTKLLAGLTHTQGLERWLWPFGCSLFSILDGPHEFTHTIASLLNISSRQFNPALQPCSTSRIMSSNPQIIVQALCAAAPKPNTCLSLMDQKTCENSKDTLPQQSLQRHRGKARHLGIFSLKLISTIKEQCKQSYVHLSFCPP